MVEPWVREALIRLNPEIAAQPDRADEVIYNLRACLLSVQADGLVRANENFMAWLRGEKTMPFGPHGEHVTVRLVDAAQPAEQPADGLQPVDLSGRRGGEAVRPGLSRQRPACGHRRGQDAHAQCGDLVRRRLSGKRDLRKTGAGHVRAERLLLRHRGPSVPLRLHPHAHRYVGPMARRGKPGRRPASPRAGIGLQHAPARSGARHPAELHPFRHGQKVPAHQGHLPLPAVFHHQSDRRPRGEGLSEKGPDLAFPGQRQVAPHGLCRPETTNAPDA